jgi:hypothetical protein
MADHILETGRPMTAIGLPGNDGMSIAVSWTRRRERTTQADSGRSRQ